MKIELRQHQTTSRAREVLTHAQAKRRFALVGAPFNQMAALLRAPIRQHNYVSRQTVSRG